MGIAAVDFDYLRKLVREHSAIVIDPGKEYLAECRLAPVVREEKCESVQDLLRRLRSEPFSGVHRKVLDAMTNNETWFFRDVTPFEVLGRFIIPEMLSRRTTERRLRFWSAACSSGQEAYSIAMMMREQFNLPGWEIRILGSDISDAILQRARAGRYSQMEINRGLPATMFAKYFRREGMEWHLSDDIRNMVTFQFHNLSQAWVDMPKFDVIFLRNVLIYFDMEIRKQILARVRQVIRPDGYLFLGGAETTLNLDNSFERVQFEKYACYRLKG